MKKMIWRILMAVMMLIVLITGISLAAAERSPWDCPQCGRKGNTGNFCGGCGHPAPTPAPSNQLEVGSHVTFGHYPQTADGTDNTPIEWLVLDIDRANHKALLISRYGLDTQRYNTIYERITWEICTLRTWLNSSFIDKAFSAEEKNAILLTDVDNSNNQGYSNWDTGGGYNTQDKVFLLSYAEANKYFDVTVRNSNNVESRVAPTVYALKQGAYTNISYKTDEGQAAGWWWLRSPGYYQYIAARVYADGSLLDCDVRNVLGVVRPALWINLESDIF